MSVIIIGYNAKDSLQSCLRSVDANRPSFPIEVLLIDNASPEPLGSEITKHLTPADRMLRMAHNVGFARACNLASAQARGEYLLLLNPDAQIRPGTIENLVRASRDDVRAGVVGGRLIHQDGTLDPQSCWGLPSVWSMLCFATGLSTVFAGSLLFDPESLGRWQRDTPREVGIVTGCLLLCRRSVWRDLGGFDPDYFMYSEDADLCWRARQAGYRVIITPDATALHEGGRSSSASDKSVLILRGKMTYLRKRHLGFRGTLMASLLRTGVALRGCTARALGHTESGWAHGWIRRVEWKRGYPAYAGPRMGSASDAREVAR